MLLLDTSSEARRQQIVTNLLARVDVRLGGTRPWDIVVHDDRFFRRVLRDGDLGAGEAYMDGWWDCEAIDQLSARICSGDLLADLKPTAKLFLALSHNKLFNRQHGKRGHAVAEEHYDLGNEMFAAILGRTMNYTCGYWRNATDLDTAQDDKMDLICRKLRLRQGEHLVDIGCGWGGLARFAAERYGCRVTGITISKEQQVFAQEACRGLPVEVLLMDYRDPEFRALKGVDKVVAVGMMEHVGKKNYHRLISACRHLLPDHGLMLVQCIGRTVDTAIDLWVDRYIFPNSYLPTMADIAAVSHGSMIMEDWHNFGADYDPTLMAWHQRFEAWAKNGIAKSDPRQYRMWRYYFLTFAGCFRIRTRLQLWQIVLAKGGARGYMSVR